jgi:hypothetical protein
VSRAVPATTTSPEPPIREVRLVDLHRGDRERARPGDRAVEALALDPVDADVARPGDATASSRGTVT